MVACAVSASGFLCWWCPTEDADAANMAARAHRRALFPSAVCAVGVTDFAGAARRLTHPSGVNEARTGHLRDAEGVLLVRKPTGAAFLAPDACLRRPRGGTHTLCLPQRRVGLLLDPVDP